MFALFGQYSRPVIFYCTENPTNPGIENWELTELLFRFATDREIRYFTSKQEHSWRNLRISATSAFTLFSKLARSCSMGYIY